MTTIREYQPKDASEVEECIVELQDFCKAIDPLMADGRAVARKYLAHLLAECALTGGRIFVAEIDSKVAGMVCVFAKLQSTAPDEEAHEYAYVSDLSVRAGARHKGLGRALLQRAEQHARSQGARLLRLAVHAGNHVARDLYLSDGYRERIAILQKEVSAGSDDLTL